MTLPNLMPTTKANGRVFWYVRRKGLPLAPMPDLPHDDPAFLAAYAAAMAVAAPVNPAKAAETGLALHVRNVLASPRYRSKSATYRAGIRRHADDIVRRFGDLPAESMRGRHIAADVAENPTPDMRLKTWRFICKGMQPDPSKTVTVERHKTDGYPAWEADDITKFRARWPIGTAPRAAMELLFWTGARISDGASIGIAHVGSDGVLAFRQRKTGGMAYVPWTCPLPAYAVDMWRDRELAHEAVAPFAGHLTFLATQQGRGRSIKALGTLVQFACAKAGIAKSAHGLRKARATVLADAGATVHQIAAWTGHETLQLVELYTRKADRRRAVMGSANPKTRTGAN